MHEAFELVEVLGPFCVGGALPRAQDVDRAFEHLAARLHQRHQGPEGILIAAAKVAAEPLTADGQHASAGLLSRDLGDGLDIVADDARAAAGEDDDQLGMVAAVGLFDRFEEFALAAVHHIGFVLGRAGGGLERHAAVLTTAHLV
jgi:hypothetical protein